MANICRSYWLKRPTEDEGHPGNVTKVIPETLPEVLIIESSAIGDGIKFASESWNEQAFSMAVGQQIGFVQDNHSRSAKGVLCGLHYQIVPHTQGKLVHVIQEKVHDLAVDIRRSSFSFGRWTGTELSDEHHRQVWVSLGFAHGFLVLSESADFLEKLPVSMRRVENCVFAGVTP